MAGDRLGKGCPPFAKHWRTRNLVLLNESQIVPSAGILASEMNLPFFFSAVLTYSRNTRLEGNLRSYCSVRSESRRCSSSPSSPPTLAFPPPQVSLLTSLTSLTSGVFFPTPLGRLRSHTSSLGSLQIGCCGAVVSSILQLPGVSTGSSLRLKAAVSILPNLSLGKGVSFSEGEIPRSGVVGSKGTCAHSCAR